ncbi:MAG: hypothetical protein ACTHKG_13420 [Nocardioides sp.]
MSGTTTVVTTKYTKDTSTAYTTANDTPSCVQCCTCAATVWCRPVTENATLQRVTAVAAQKPIRAADVETSFIWTP